MNNRSPVLGYNHNFKHRGLLFHVQTEDSGIKNPHLFTHLFNGGVIIASRRMDYDPDSEVDMVKSLMQSQHKAVIKDLKIGTFDDKIDSYLGNKEDLLPRKADSVCNRHEEEDSNFSSRNRDASDTQIDIPQLGEPLKEDSNIKIVLGSVTRTENSKELQEAAIIAAARLRGEKVVGLGNAVVHGKSSTNSGLKRSQYRSMRPVSKSFEIPSIQAPELMRNRLPTELDESNENESLGDPMVTFAEEESSASDNVSNRKKSPSSGAYSMRRQIDSTKARRRRGTLQRTPTRARTVVRVPGGKSGAKRIGGSVQVSKPAPPQIPRDATSRKARESKPNSNIAEKSLHEVIMAYLSDEESDS